MNTTSERIDALFIPVTRPWAVEPVMAALNASDIPREVLLMLDAPDCWGWFEAFLMSGWNVTVVTTGREAPPEDRLARRPRHLAMRRESQALLRPYERVLCVEDDTIVPPDVWSRLSGLLDWGYTAATGVQYTKDGQRMPGLWRYDADLGLYDPVFGEGVGEVDACGLYCLMTTGSEYGRHSVLPRMDEAIDIAQTKAFAPIAVDFDCVCGHLREDGVVVT